MYPKTEHERRIKSREGESVADHQRRMISQIESLDWSAKGEGDEPEP